MRSFYTDRSLNQPSLPFGVAYYSYSSCVICLLPFVDTRIHLHSSKQAWMTSLSLTQWKACMSWWNPSKKTTFANYQQTPWRPAFLFAVISIAAVVGPVTVTVIVDLSFFYNLACVLLTTLVVPLFLLSCFVSVRLCFG